MENKKKRNNALMLSVLGVIALVLVTAGVTYAFFNYRKEGKTVNTIKTGTITFTSDNDGSNNNETFEIQDALPTRDHEGSISNDKFTFNVTSTNTGGQQINYIITAKKSAGSTLAADQVKVYLQPSAANGTGEINYTAPVALSTPKCSDTTYSTQQTCEAANKTWITESYKTYNDLTVEASTISYATGASATDEKVLFTGIVPAQTGTNGYNKNFDFRMWLNGETGASVADYSPYEFMLMDNTTSGASYDDVTVTGACKSELGADVTSTYGTSQTCVSPNTWITSVNVPKTTNTNAINAETAIRDGKFITSTAYYALPATHCTDGVSADSTTCSGNNGTWSATARTDYERIAYVYKDSTTNTNLVLTQSQALALDNGSSVDAFGNYTITGTADANGVKHETISDKSFEVTEQYYQINGQSFKVKINVYANATVQQ